MTLEREPTRSNAEVKSSRLTILVVDDDPIVLHALTETLKWDFPEIEVLNESNPVRALDVLRDREIACILSDQRMPEMLGVDFLIESKKYRPLASRVLITGVFALPTIIDAINRGEIHSFIAKPWRREDFVTTIKNVMHGHELRRQREAAYDAAIARNSIATAEELQYLACGVDSSPALDGSDANQFARHYTDVLRIFLHDLANEFASIGANIQMFSHVAEKADLVKKTAARLSVSMQYCQMQISTLRSINRGRDVPITRMGAGDIAQRARSMYEALLPRNVRLGVSDLSEGRAVLSNMDVATFILIEFMRNAAKAMKKGGGEIELRVVNRDENSVQIQVCDEGPGFPAEIAANPFAMPVPGSGKGWGLYLCNRCATGIRATVHFGKNTTRGAIQELSLPTSLIGGGP